LAVAAEGLPTLEDRLRLVQEVAYRWDLGAPEHRAARAAAVATTWQEPEPQRRHRRFPVGQDYGSGRPRERGFDPAKKVEGRKRHLLVDTEGLVLKAKVHSANVPDQDGLRVLLESARARLSRLKHLWVDAGYQGRGRRWAQEALGLSVEVVRKPPKPVPEKVAKLWAQEWAKEGKKVDWQGLMPPRGFRVLPRRWVVERTFAWISHNRRMSLWTTSG
jgi:transposase